MLVPTGAIKPDCGSMKAILTVLVWASAEPVASNDAHATNPTFMESRNILSPLWNNLCQQEYWKRTRPVKQTEHSNHTFQSPGERPLLAIPRVGSRLRSNLCSGQLVVLELLTQAGLQHLAGCA